MNGSKWGMLRFMGGLDHQFIIPVYQRKYEWKHENCQQLYNDLKKVVLDKRPSHFFGSIVTFMKAKAAMTEVYIIDGQQRFTTVTLLLLAIRNLVRGGELPPTNCPAINRIEPYLLNPPEENLYGFCPNKNEKPS